MSLFLDTFMKFLVSWIFLCKVYQIYLGQKVELYFCIWFEFLLFTSRCLWLACMWKNRHKSLSHSWKIAGSPSQENMGWKGRFFSKRQIPGSVTPDSLDQSSQFQELVRSFTDADHASGRSKASKNLASPPGWPLLSRSQVQMLHLSLEFLAQPAPDAVFRMSIVISFLSPVSVINFILNFLLLSAVHHRQSCCGPSDSTSLGTLYSFSFVSIVYDLSLFK